MIKINSSLVTNKQYVSYTILNSYNNIIDTINVIFRYNPDIYGNVSINILDYDKHTITIDLLNQIKVTADKFKSYIDSCKNDNNMICENSNTSLRFIKNSFVENDKYNNEEYHEDDVKVDDEYDKMKNEKNELINDGDKVSECGEDNKVKCDNIEYDDIEDDCGYLDKVSRNSED